MDTFEKARIADAITRAEMAKMISIYATKILGRQPDTTKTQCTQFSDRHEVNAELQQYLITICQLELMGYWSNGIEIKSSFNPNATITRAEVGVVLSRLLRGNTYANSENQRYQNHLLALYKAKIITLIDNPMMQELRGNILLMLLRMSQSS
jgi:hypothetical protein